MRTPYNIARYAVMPALFERAIHTLLKLRNAHKADAPGTEWFVTSESELDAIYSHIINQGVTE